MTIYMTIYNAELVNSRSRCAGRNPVIVSSSINEVIMKTSTNKHLLCVMDHRTGEKLYNIPVDMNVDHIIIQEGLILLINANNMMLSVILDFDV